LLPQSLDRFGKLELVANGGEEGVHGPDVVGVKHHEPGSPLVV
jgi:hypothetical protein